MRSTGKQQTRLRFFFSSRRRHTRSLRDWSSDVCSSDLELIGETVGEHSEDLRADVVEYSPAELRGFAGDGQVGDYVDAGTRALLSELGADRRLRRAGSARLPAGCLDHCRVDFGVPLDEAGS